ncbi:MAG TPA: hypothetical protein VG937_38225 [Polyangiaceae bacterium]|nr:hypothetical protein [Polyangiaceae bacterium]
MFALLIAGCSARTELGSSEAGSIFVFVRNGSSAPADDAIITTDPLKIAIHADENGTALFSDVAAGVYKVTARAHGLIATDAVQVISGKVSRVSLLLGAASVPSTGGAPSFSTGGRFNSFGGTSSSGGRVGSGGNSSARGGSVSAQGGSGSAQGGSTAPGTDSINVGTQVEAMCTDPKRPYLYAVDKVNNSLLFVNLNSRKVEKSIFVGSAPVDLDLGLDANELYVANFGSTQISVVDLEKQEIGRSLFVDTSKGIWDGNPYRLAVTANDTLVFTSEDQWNDLKLVNAQNGGSIAAVGSLYSPDLEATADGAFLFVGESGSSNGLHRFAVTEATLQEVDQSTAGGARKVVLSGDEKFVFYGSNKILAANLKSVLGKFAETIYATNADGSLAIGNASIFDGNTFATLASLPVSTTVMATSADGATLYLYDIKTSKITLVDLSKY